ncbi:hypothetical protein QNA19_24885, partial [Rhodococcus fascians]|uniref:hypothetical protein n=1 Tax=Rhodococcoides fascians TaxID=1828 RepID=UPI0024B9547A
GGTRRPAVPVGDVTGRARAHPRGQLGGRLAGGLPIVVPPALVLSAQSQVRLRGGPVWAHPAQ